MTYSRSFLSWLLPLAWGVLIIVLSLMPGGPGQLNFLGIPHFDKVGHFGMYAVWTFLIVKALMSGMTVSVGRALGVAVLVGSIAGIGLEYGQYFMHQGRSFELADMVANAAGALAGAWGGRLLRRIRLKCY